MATTNDDSAINLGRLKTFKNKLDSEDPNIATSPSPNGSEYVKASVANDFACAIGNGAQAFSAAAVALGVDAKAVSEATVAIGANTTVNSERSVAVGSGCHIEGEPDCVALGNEAIPTGGGGGNTCVGSQATSSEGSGGNTVLGAKASIAAGVSSSVALGAESEATDSKEVSVGSSTIKRRIANVATPTQPTDATTKKYVDTVKTHIIEVESPASTLTPNQLKDLDGYWPNVVLVVTSLHSAYFPSIRKTNDQGIDIFTLYSIKPMTSNFVEVGTDHTVSFITQADIEDENGSIVFSGQCSLYPVIATNPIFTSNVDVSAIGENSIAAGIAAASSGADSVAIGHSANAETSASIALGQKSHAKASGAIAIGQSALADKTASVAFGMGALTDRNYQVSVGSKITGTTRYLSNVKDPVEDQDAATRYWVKNADRSDVFSTNHVSSASGGTGELYLEVNADLNWVSLRGYLYWSSFSDAWANMVHMPGETNGWWIKTDLKVPDKMKPKSNFIAYCAGLDFLGDRTLPYYTDDFAVGTDGYIYFSKWSTSHGSTPLGIVFFGHRFYM